MTSLSPVPCPLVFVVDSLTCYNTPTTHTYAMLPPLRDVHLISYRDLAESCSPSPGDRVVYSLIVSLPLPYGRGSFSLEVVGCPSLGWFSTGSEVGDIPPIRRDDCYSVLRSITCSTGLVKCDVSRRLNTLLEAKVFIV